jgi:tetratricopeptide (TPR) repeat protein
MADNPRIEELRRRVQADPASIAFAALAEEYRRAGRFEDAIDACRTGLQRHPSYLSARVTLGRSLLELQKYDEAQKELALVLKAAPENLAAIRALAEIHERRGDAPEALEQYKAAVSVARQDSPAPASRPADAAPPSAPAAAPFEWSLPKPQPTPAGTPEPARAAIAVATAEPKSEPQALRNLQQFLASIQAARRSAVSEHSTVGAR